MLEDQFRRGRGPLEIVLPFEHRQTKLDLSIVTILLAQLPLRHRDEAIDAIAEVCLRVVASQIFASSGTSWEDSDSEGRVVVTFHARPSIISILDLSFVDAPARLGSGRFVLEGHVRRIFPIPDKRGPSALCEWIVAIDPAAPDARALLIERLRALAGKMVSAAHATRDGADETWCIDQRPIVQLGALAPGGVGTLVFEIDNGQVSAAPAASPSTAATSSMPMPMPPQG